jgi:hypothetical protein
MYIDFWLGITVLAVLLRAALYVAASYSSCITVVSDAVCYIMLVSKQN